MGDVIEFHPKDDQILLTEKGYLFLVSTPEFRVGHDDRVTARQAAHFLRDSFGRTESVDELMRELLASWKKGA